MKMAPVLEAVRRDAADVFDGMLVHTGQHYDPNMSDVFFADLDMPQPDKFLGVGSGTHAEQTGRVMVAMERLLDEEQPDLVMVAGDVNSTLASAIVAAKAWIPLGHIEAGLRSFDRTMPEEINRIVADEFSRFCFVTEPSGLQNLKAEGIGEDRIFYVGNTMIDSLEKHLPATEARLEKLAKQYDFEVTKYVLVTLHRPSNVDTKEHLTKLIELFEKTSRAAHRIIFPIHPRTRKRLEEFGLDQRIGAIKELIVIDPVGYLDFLAFERGAAVVLTDSGGVQEETTALHVPCITIRDNTERPITIAEGTNELTGLDVSRILDLTTDALAGKWKTGRTPKLWDGKAAERIVQVLRNHAS